MRSLDQVIEELVDRIDKAYNDHTSPQLPQAMTLASSESALNMLMKSVKQRAHVVLICCESEKLADLIAVNLLRVISIGERVATLHVGHANSNDLALGAALMASMMKIPIQALMSGQLTASDWESISVALGCLHEAPLHMVDGGADSLAENVDKWQTQVEGGDTHLLLLHGLDGFDTKPVTQGLSFEIGSDMLRTLAEHVSNLSVLSHQNGVSVIVVLGSLLMPLPALHEQLYKQGCPIQGVGADICHIEIKSESVVRVNYKSPQGTVESDYLFDWPCRRIEWEPDAEKRRDSVEEPTETEVTSQAKQRNAAPIIDPVAYLVCADGNFKQVIGALGGRCEGGAPMHMTGRYLVILPRRVKLQEGEVSAGGVTANFHYVVELSGNKHQTESLDNVV